MMCRSVCVLVATGLAGCVMLAPKPAPVNDWQLGYRFGRVAALYSADTSRASLPTCLRDIPVEQLGARHFAAVRYRSMRVEWTVVAELPPFASGVSVGDRVEFLTADRNAGKLAAIRRVIVAQVQ